jgi:hypothetical protein
MNNLIEKFSIQAKDSVPEGLPVNEWIQSYNHKFAELIITECINICNTGTDTQTTSYGASLMIKNHFGIKDE